MQGVGFFSAIIIGILAGWIAEKVMSRSHGLFTNLIVGLIGAFIGPAVLRIFNLVPVEGGFWPSLVVSTVGAIIFLFILGLFRRRS
ncbi:GlsB/YeaQ/YmgE family stress response membrane protein [Chelatococcus sp. GCM10030263]|uniref:GlsB/YeaQ/YmgE family stress response membrane protein n=1 Tax=Chelatococcus sp. GCM10030263 TaxID=3273387 RepID=UPI003608EA18